MTEQAAKKVSVIDNIGKVAKLIKDLSTIAGAVTGLYIIAANWLPNTDLGRFVTNTLDPLINPTRFSEGYVYYEVGLDGELTSYGQLRVFPTNDLPPFESLDKGVILQAKSEVYLRPTPSTQKDFIRVFGEEQCFKITEVARELSGAELGAAQSGGWIGVVETKC